MPASFDQPPSVTMSIRPTEARSSRITTALVALFAAFSWLGCSMMYPSRTSIFSTAIASGNIQLVATTRSSSPRAWRNWSTRRL